jgi:hypothetical protein
VASGRDNRARLTEQVIEETEGDRKRDSRGQAIVQAEGRPWQERLVRARDEVQQQQASAEEWIADERRQHDAEQQRRGGCERRTRPDDVTSAAEHAGKPTTAPPTSAASPCRHAALAVR